jgi:drug/metabolite transporter (DMT)-like permease
MTGAMWAVIAGVGFGVFQSINRRAVRGMDVFQATFLQLLVSAMVLAAITLVTQDLNLLRTAPPGALIHFSLAGLMPFFVGWTFLNASQKRIGASRTSPLIATNPLFAALIAMLTWREFPNLPAWVGMLSIRNPLVFSPANAYNRLRHEVVVGDRRKCHRWRPLLDCRWSPRIDHRYTLGA